MKQKSIWKEWIPIIREKYRKKQTFQSNGFLKYFGWSRNPYNFQNMGKVNSHSNEKIWENTNISKLSVSEIFCLKQKSMQFPKHRKSGLPLYGKSMEKHKHFKFMGFLNISDEAEIHTIPRAWEKWMPMIREEYGRKQTFQSNGFFNYFEWSRNPCNSQNMAKVNSYSKGKNGKTQTFQGDGFLKYFGRSRNPYNSKNMGKVNLHSTGKARENTEISHSLCYIADLEFIRTHGIPNVC